LLQIADVLQAPQILTVRLRDPGVVLNNFDRFSLILRMLPQDELLARVVSWPKEAR